MFFITSRPGLLAQNVFSYMVDEVPMTPKTPMPYSQIICDDHRTPGQILSLRSTFAFVSKNVYHKNCIFFGHFKVYGYSSMFLCHFYLACMKVQIAVVVTLTSALASHFKALCQSFLCYGQGTVRRAILYRNRSC